MTGEQKAGVLIGDRERKAVDPIAGAKLALEVSGPEIIRTGRSRRHDAGVLMRPPAPPPQHQAAAREQIRRGTGRGPPRHSWVPRRENAEQFAGAPEGVLAPQRTEELGELGVDAMRAVVRGPTAIA